MHVFLAVMRSAIAAPAVLAVVLVLTAPSAAGARRHGDGPGPFIQGLADRAVAALGSTETSAERKEALFGELLDAHFAVEAIGEWVLGRYWRLATPAERKEYLALFREMLVVTYLDRFRRYSGERLTVTDTVAEAGGDVIVFSRLERGGGAAPVAVGWRVRRFDGALRIVDVAVEGVSMSRTQRAEFASIIRRGGGKVAALLAAMRSKVGDTL